jgi:aspartate kinase
MAYYGAQVIHPKTIKPLQNKNIPLYVKCFLDPSLQGTTIHNRLLKNLPPIIVIKEKQAMIELSSKDFSFIEEKPIADLFHLLEKLKIKPNMTQNAAISMICVFDDRPDKIEKLALAASDFFDINVTKGLTLLTVRHYTKEVYEKLTTGKKMLLQQTTKETVQSLLQ